MSKAILFVDMPNNCYECNLQAHNVTGEKICIKTREHADYCSSKPDWCPLKPLPEKCDVKKAKTITIENWIEGWNTCIDAILKDME